MTRRIREAQELFELIFYVITWPVRWLLRKIRRKR